MYMIMMCVCMYGGAGGVTSNDDFLAKFFHSVLVAKSEEVERSNQYCEFNSQVLQLFTSSLYMASLVATLLASVVTRRYGRRATMLVGGLLFDAGVIFNGAAHDVYMLIIGRILLGCGIGFANQV